MDGGSKGVNTDDDTSLETLSDFMNNHGNEDWSASREMEVVMQDGHVEKQNREGEEDGEEKEDEESSILEITETTEKSAEGDV